MRLWKRFKDLKKSLAYIDTKDDIRKMSVDDQQMYHFYRRILGVDLRLKPSSTLTEFQRYESTGLVFKSDAIAFDLSTVDDVAQDKYHSSYKLSAKVTDAIMREGDTILSLSVEFRSIDICYDRDGIRKIVEVVLPGSNDLAWIQRLPERVMINIEDTAYNKNGIEFLYDWNNVSDSFEQNCVKKIYDGEGNTTVTLYYF